MKRILCYGDSNTWGYVPGSGKRFDENVRWTGVLQEQLGNAYRIIEEGLSGRTIASDDGRDWTRNGSKLLLPCLQSHAPLNLVVLMLGTNDVKSALQNTTEKITQNISYLVRAIQKSDCGVKNNAPHVLLVAPPPLGPLSGEVALEFAGGVEKSLALSTAYKTIAGQLNCNFFDAGSVIQTSATDGVHFDEDSHRTFGIALSRHIRTFL